MNTIKNNPAEFNAIKWLLRDLGERSILTIKYFTASDCGDSRMECSVDDKTHKSVSPKWLGFGDDEQMNYYIDLTTREISNSWGMVLGVIDREFVEMFKPYYVKHYLEKLGEELKHLCFLVDAKLHNEFLEMDFS